MTMRMCRNLFAKMLKSHLGEEISAVQHVSSSALYHRDGSVDRTNENLHLRCTWEELIAHLKLVLSSKGLNFRYRIVTDEQIKTSFVSADAKRDDTVMLDLVGEIFKLVIIRVGFLGYKNKAAEGALKEALLIRRGLDLPTWLVEDPELPWQHSNGTEIQAYLADNFTEVSLGAKEKVRKVERSPAPEFVDFPSEDPDLSEITSISLPGKPVKKGWRQ